MDVHSPLFKNIATLLIGVLTLNPLVSLAADLAVDGAAAGNTGLGQAGNGVPVINIATPNAGGLSHNRFIEYNVGQQGLILNNARDVQATQLGGYIHANPNLAGSAAGLILNEVTGSNPSQLKGYTEVAGQRAGVIVANPHGITCDGCGFINTPRAVLSTGKPVIEDGQLRRFDVDQGEIVIDGAGINATNVDQFDLITRSAKINAELHANQLNVVAGRNEVDADTLVATPKAADGSDKPLLAVDSSALGGMYAGSIRLVGTEHGVGVRLAGDMAASAGDMHIDANGQLSLGRLATLGDLHLSGQAINLAQGYAEGKAELHASEQVNVTGSLVSGAGLLVQADQLYNHGVIETGIALDGSRQPQADMEIKTQHLGNAGLMMASGTLDVETQTLDNRSATMASVSALRITTEQLDNHDGQLISEAGLSLQATAASNAEGLVSAGQDARLVVVDAFDNREGLIVSNAQVDVQADKLDNRGGQIGAAQQLNVSATRLDNSNLGTLSSQGAMALNVTGRLANHDQGALISTTDMQVRAGQLDNSEDGVVVASGSLELQIGNDIDNRNGTLVASHDLKLQAAELDNRDGDLSAGNTLQAKVSSQLDNRQGMLASSGLLDLEVGSLDNTSQGQLVSQGDITLRADQLDNADGVLYAQGNAVLRVQNQLDNRGGVLLADAGLTLNAGELLNHQGTVQATSGALVLGLDGSLDNTDGLLLAGDGLLEVNADRISNQGGVITSLKGMVSSVSRLFSNLTGVVQADDVTLQVAETLNNDLGHIAAVNGNLQVDTQRLSNMHGALFARELLSINAEQLNNNDSLLELFTSMDSTYSQQEWIDFYRQMIQTNWDGFVADAIAQGLEPFLGDTGVTRKQELLALLDAIEQDPQALQQGSLIHAKRINLDVDRLSQTVTSQILAEQQLAGTGQDWTNHGFMASDGTLDLHLTGHYGSYGTLASVGQLDLHAGSLGLELGNEDIGGILGGSDVSVSVDGQLSNSGQLTAMGDLQVEATDIANLGVLGAADQLQITSAKLYNHLGLVFSGNNMFLQIDQLANHDADIYSLAGLRLTGQDPARRAQQLDNISGTIESAGNMQLNVDQLNNRKEVFREEQVQLEGAMTVRCYDCSGDHHNVDYIGREVFESRVLEDSPAALLHSGGQLSIQATDIANRFSTLSASGDLLIQADNLQNLGAVGARTERTRTWNTGRTTDGTDSRFRRDYINPYNLAALPKQLPLEALARYREVSDVSIVTPLDANAPAVIQAGGNLIIEARQQLENSRVVGNDLPAWHDDPTRNDIAAALQDIIKVQVNAQLPPDLQQQQVNPLGLPAFSLPSGQQGLFRLVQTPAGSAPGPVLPGSVNAPTPGGHRYLIETNPALTNLGQFLGSEYLLGQLGLDPNQTLKRLGDGLYEQHLIRQAVTARTGARYLAGLTSDEAMYRYLMDNALASKDALGLTLGVTLTAEQVAALTHDIVWLEEHEVMGERVLVPVLYLAQAEGRLAPSGALLQGQDVVLISGADLRNQGTLRAAANLGIIAENIDNSGLLQAHERVQLIAQDSIRNAQGGIITGRDVSLNAGGDIINERTATYYESSSQPAGLSGIKALAGISSLLRGIGGSASDSGTVLDNAARIEATNDLDMHAGGNLINQGAVLQADGDARLSAGQDLVIGAVEETSSSLRKDRRHHWESSQTTQHGSEVTVGGDLQAQAGNDLAVIASRIDVGGDASLNAAGDVTLISAANEQHNVYRYRRSDKKVTRENSLVEQQGAEVLAGGDVVVASGQDMTLVASRIQAAGDVGLYADGDINLLSGLDEQSSYYMKQEKKSFGRSSARQSESYTSTNVATQVEAGGNLLVNVSLEDQGRVILEGGQNVTIIGSQLTAGEDLAVGALGNVTVLSGVEEHGSYSKKSDSGFLGLSRSGRSELRTQATQVASELQADNDVLVLAGNDVRLRASNLTAGNDSEIRAGLITEIGDINLVSAQDQAYSLRESYRSKVGLSSSGSSISVASARKAGDEAISSTAVGSQVLAEQDALLVAERDINLEGSRIAAGRNVSLDAGRDVTILAANNQSGDRAWEQKSQVGLSWASDDNSVSVFAGKESEQSRQLQTTSTAAGSQVVAGQDVMIDAGRAINQVGSGVFGSRDVDLQAGRNIKIDAAQDTLSQEQHYSESRQGLGVSVNHNFGQTKDALGNAGSGDNSASQGSSILRAVDSTSQFFAGPSSDVRLGSSSASFSQQYTAETNRSSTLGAGNNLTLTANNDLSVNGSYLDAGRDISLKGQDVTLGTAQGSYSDSYQQSQSWGGVHGGTSGGIKAGIGGNRGVSDGEGTEGTISATHLNAGRNINLEASNNLSLISTQAQASNNIDLRAGNDIEIRASQTSSSSDSDRRSAGGGVGLALGSEGVGVYFNVNVGIGNQQREGIQHQEAYLYAGNQLNFSSGRDTVIAGAQLRGENVTGRVGRDLLVSSVVDTGSVSGEEFDLSATVVIGPGSSVSGAVGAGRSSGETNWVQQQTSITSADQMDIRTENHTQLDAALIASDTGNLKLDTGTLGFSDIHGRDKEDSYYLNIGGSYGLSNGSTQQDSSQVGKGDEGVSGWSLEGHEYTRDREQIVRATVGEGEVLVRNDAGTGEDSTAGLNRDVSRAFEITKDEEERTDLYVTKSSVEAVASPRETMRTWQENAENYGRHSVEAFTNLEILKTAAQSEAEHNQLVAALAWAPALLVDAMDAMDTATLSLGVFPGVANHGGLITQLPVMVTGDLRPMRVTGTFKTDEDGQLVLVEGKPVLEDGATVEYFTGFSEEVDKIFTNGIMNSMEEAVVNGLMQTGHNNGEFSFVLAYNPTHGLIGDAIETMFDNNMQGAVLSGTARNLNSLYRSALDAGPNTLHIYGHSQGAVLTWVAIKGLDFSQDGRIDVSLNTIQLSGAPIDAMQFHRDADKAGFKDEENRVFQVNRPDETVFFGLLPKTDTVSDLPLYLGGNAQYSDDPLARTLGALFTITSLFGEGSPHSNYSCVTCGLPVPGSVNSQVREIVIKPTLIDSQGNAGRLE
ncbi:filamentous hemagglutinin [Halopseudomonas yangmingensis]|uniref:Filamentous hemagglutinin n=1 Tax=Halopseudomonas yangmingensis TaxID=1720063 RepID=A0A1I4RE84_9GAMM|nr:filamentous hemagglutinin [Halopseudomonas yangmingensis]